MAGEKTKGLWKDPAYRARMVAAHKGRNTKHGMCIRGVPNKFYSAWQSAKQRCENKNATAYRNYGGRGIRMKWKSFEEFRDDMYEAYLEHARIHGEKQTTLDRIDVDGHYEKANCRWVTWSIQQSNKRLAVTCKRGHSNFKRNKAGCRQCHTCRNLHARNLYARQKEQHKQQITSLLK